MTQKCAFFVKRETDNGTDHEANTCNLAPANNFVEFEVEEDTSVDA